MADISKILWIQFIKGLNSSGISIPLESFKVATGLQIAEWQYLDYTGVNKADDFEFGDYNYENLYSTADPMPNYKDFYYLPSTNFFDQYAAYIHSIKDNQNDYTLKTAKERLGKYTMGPDELPGYKVQPDLQNWFLSCLIANDKNPKIKFTVKLKTDDSGSGLPPSLALKNSRSTKRGSRVLKKKTLNVVPPFIKVNTGATNMRASPLESRSLISNEKSTFTTEKDIHANEFLFEFEAQNAQVFSIRPDRWYNSAMITNYYDKIDPGAPIHGKPLFGENGVLNNRVVSALVIYKRTVTITSKNTQHLQSIHAPDYLNSAVNSIDIGGFTFNGGGATNFSTHAPPESNSSSYIYSDNSNAPIIIGFQVEKLGPSN